MNERYISLCLFSTRRECFLSQKRKEKNEINVKNQQQKKTKENRRFIFFVLKRCVFDKKNDGSNKISTVMTNITVVNAK